MCVFRHVISPQSQTLYNDQPQPVPVCLCVIRDAPDLNVHGLFCHDYHKHLHDMSGIGLWISNSAITIENTFSDAFYAVLIMMERYPALPVCLLQSDALSGLPTGVFALMH